MCARYVQDMYCTQPPVQPETKKYARTARAPATHRLNYDGGGEGFEPKVLETSRETLAGLMIASVWKGMLDYSLADTTAPHLRGEIS